MRESVQQGEKLRSTGVKIVVLKWGERSIHGGGKYFIIKAQTTHKAEQRRYGANAQAWGNALLLRSALWFGGVQ